MKVLVYLDVFLRTVTRRSKYSVVSTTKGIVSLLPLAVTSCSRADSAMIKLAIIQWKGEFCILQEHLTGFHVVTAEGYLILLLSGHTRVF